MLTKRCLTPCAITDAELAPIGYSTCGVIVSAIDSAAVASAVREVGGVAIDPLQIGLARCKAPEYCFAIAFPLCSNSCG